MRTPVTKVDFWNRLGKDLKTDIEQRKYGEQKGLETPVVYAVNDVHSLSRQSSDWIGKKANALNVPPGE